MDLTKCKCGGEIVYHSVYFPKRYRFWQCENCKKIIKTEQVKNKMKGNN